MNVPYSPNMDVVKLNVDLNPVLYNASVDQVYQKPPIISPPSQAQELHVASAKKGVASRHGKIWLPRLAFYYGVYSNYSTAATTTALARQYYLPGVAPMSP